MLIIIEQLGILKFVDVVDGLFVKEIVDEVMGIFNKVVIDWCVSFCGVDLKFVFLIVDENGEMKKLSSGSDVVYFFFVDVIFLFEDGL